ncbi:hypothetical protein WG66_013825 [Moniliophthora roreri]|nr:hypothetical protein WG66_013825 [Moniliophthora roreri]
MASGICLSPEPSPQNLPLTQHRFSCAHLALVLSPISEKATITLNQMSERKAHPEFKAPKSNRIMTMKQGENKENGASVEILP